MKVDNKHYRTIWEKSGDLETVQIIDQRQLPYEFVVEDIQTVEQMGVAIKDMYLRGAGLIGAAGGYGMYLAALQSAKSDDFDSSIQAFAEELNQTRPTAINLSWAINRQLKAIQKGLSQEEKIQIALNTARDIADEDADYCLRIGEHGLQIIQEIAARKSGEPVNILTHCNAGWLAFVDHGTATAPIYAAHNRGINVHVWVDETRPRNQGARLTAWELNQEGVPHTVIADNVGGHLMQHGMVDMVIVGSDRTTYTGDVGNKIGTYLKALAAKDNNVPFYAALPSSTIDWEIEDGVKGIPIEQRGSEEVKFMEGFHDGEVKEVRLMPEESSAANYAFDITPARLVAGIITERGICQASKQGVLDLFPEMKKGKES
jgi:methylthioribose-1-phosphate isomerase